MSEQYDRDKVTKVDFGADALISVEYHIPNAPLSVFGDAKVLMELFDNPLFLYWSEWCRNSVQSQIILSGH